jgi:hypothetical protein
MTNEINYVDGEYLYKSYDLVSKIDQTNLIQESEIYLNTHRDPIEPHPPARAYASTPQSQYTIIELSRKRCWNNLLKKIFLETNNYYKNYLNSTPVLVNFWIDKVGFYSNEDIDNILYFDNDLNAYTDNIYHIHKKTTSVSCIFYLQNPNKRYGTLIKTKNRSLVLDGTENSLSIFNSRTWHTAVYPDREESLNYPRYTIGFDFRKKLNPGEPIPPNEY